MFFVACIPSPFQCASQTPQSGMITKQDLVEDEQKSHEIDSWRLRERRVCQKHGELRLFVHTRET